VKISPFRLLFLSVILFLPSCKSAKKKPVHEISGLYVVNLHYRRPEVRGVDPKAEPGVVGWQRDPLPNDRYDCEAIDHLWAGIDLAAVRGCLGSIDSKGESAPDKKVLYRLKREPAPYLELLNITADKPEERAPECLALSLPKIPMPREIIYQAPLREDAPESTPENPQPVPPYTHLSCYSSRLEIEADEIISGIKVPRMKMLDLALNFPLKQRPQDDVETKGLLLQWVLTFFRSQEGEFFSGKVLPDLWCAHCMGSQDTLVPQGGALPRSWPK
jgi:hypothetical protein